LGVSNDTSAAAVFHPKLNRLSQMLALNQDSMATSVPWQSLMETIHQLIKDNWTFRRLGLLSG